MLVIKGTLPTCFPSVHISLPFTAPYQLYFSHFSCEAGTKTPLDMQITTEAIIGLVSLVVMCPPSLFLLWSCIKRSNANKIGNMSADNGWQLQQNHNIASMPPVPRQWYRRDRPIVINPPLHSDDNRLQLQTRVFTYSDRTLVFSANTIAIERDPVV